MNLRRSALRALSLPDPAAKLAQVHALWDARTQWCIDPQEDIAEVPEVGLPARPVLVDPRQVPKRSPQSREGHAALMHAIAHIEFTAINLALDALWRFPHLPPEYYQDWARIAHEEAEHFGLIEAHLQGLGYGYGDFAAHAGLWSLCEATRHDACARMALVPRTLEARGLDATPLIQDKLRAVGSEQALAAVRILDRILHDEIAHVAAGIRWYQYLCECAGHDPQRYHEDAARRYRAPRPKGPFNLGARRAAGFSEHELLQLDPGAAAKP